MPERLTKSANTAAQEDKKSDKPKSKQGFKINFRVFLFPFPGWYSQNYLWPFLTQRCRNQKKLDLIGLLHFINNAPHQALVRSFVNRTNISGAAPATAEDPFVE